MKKGNALSSIPLCDSDRIQTCNLLIRSQVLYSVELRNHKTMVATTEKPKLQSLIASAKVGLLIGSAKSFSVFFPVFFHSHRGVSAGRCDNPLL